MTETTVHKTTMPLGPGENATIPTRLMVLGMAQRDGTIQGADLVPVMEACGLSNDQVRSCLRRLVNEGLFTRVGEGKASRFEATDAGHTVLRAIGDRTVLAYAQDAAGRGWDRQWRIVAFAIPESMRPARDAFRDRLLALGAASVHNGLYVSPHRWDSDVQAEMRRLDIAHFVTTATTDDLEVGAIANPRELAAQLWSLDTVAARYHEFIADYERVPELLDEMRRRGQQIAEHDFLPGALQVAIRFMRCFELDPLLPPELLPKNWPGREARTIMERCRRIGLLARQDKSGPAMFRVYDEAIASLP